MSGCSWLLASQKMQHFTFAFYVFDKYFTCLTLPVDELSHKGLQAIGTIRETITEKCAVKGRQKTKKYHWHTLAKS